MNSKFPDGWTVQKLDQVLECIIDYRGKTPHKSSFGVPLITAKMVKNGRIDFTKSEFIPENLYKSWMRRGIPKKGDVLLTTEAPLGEIAQLNTDKRIALAQRIVVLRGKHLILDNVFLKYALMSPFCQAQIKSRETGTTVLGIKQSELREVKIQLPSLPEQHKIAEILSSLDDRIELNYEMNRTLKATAQTIFESWFVDFEPFKNELVYSEELKREVPKGWRIVELEKVLSLKYGKGLPERERKHGNIPVYGSNGIVGWHNKALVKGPGIVVGRKGTAGSVLWSHIDFYPIDTTFYVAPKKSIRSMVYLYFELLHQNLPKLVADSAVPGLNRNIAYLNKVVLPPEDLIKQFDNSAMPLFEMIYANSQETRILEQIRDSLLPKLLSGEIRVKVKIEKEFPEETKKLEDIKKEKTKIQKSIIEWVEHA